MIVLIIGHPLEFFWHGILVLLIVGLLIALLVLSIKYFIHLRDERRNREKNLRNLLLVTKAIREIPK